MKKPIKFKHPVRGKGRPQIVLIGNGLERKSGQVAWNKLVDNLTAENCVPITEKEKDTVPFPLLYEAIVLDTPIPKVLDETAIGKEEKRLKDEMGHLVNVSNDLLDELPDLNADHIFTTNYSYCLEKAFYPKRDFSKSTSRSSIRFNTLPLDENGKQKHESDYRLHGGYLAKNSDSSDAALWHIHGETSTPRGIVLGHDRYGRLLKRIIESCGSFNYKRVSKRDAHYSFTSWPELFLFGDVYVIGFGFSQCEFDLWWLLKRKQRERYGDGTVYFYDRHMEVMDLLPVDTCASSEEIEAAEKKNRDIKWHNRGVRENVLKQKLLSAHGVQILDCGSSNDMSYDEFYKRALADVKARIQASRTADGQDEEMNN